MKLKEVNMRNFKKFREKDIVFTGEKVSIYGGNGTGKSTIITALLWVLTDADYMLKKAPIVRREENGAPVNDVNVEAEVVFQDGNNIVSFKKAQKRTIKRDGSYADANIYYVNGVEKTMRDFQDEIKDRLGADTSIIQMCLNPNAFLAQKPNEIRKFLFQKAEGISDLEIARRYVELNELVPELETYSLDEILAKYKASRKKIQAEIDQIPARIDQEQRHIVDVDTSAAELGIADVKRGIEKINEQLENASSASEELNKISNELMELQFKKGQIERDANQIIIDRRQRHDEMLRGLKKDVSEAKARVGNLENEKEALEVQLERASKEREYYENAKKLSGDSERLARGYKLCVLPDSLDDTKQVYPEIRHIPERKQYDGMIGCVTVPNGLIVVRRDGFPCISGNSNHYEYSANYNDFGHNQTTGKFFEQMDFLTPELLRVLRPGRVAAIHVKDRVLFGNATGTGMPTIEPFHAQCIEHYMHHGFQYMGMITVVTDVVRENNQTYRLGWSEQCKDGSKMSVGCPEYVLLFRKLPTDRSTAYADEPVTKTKDEYTRAQWQIDAHAFWRSSGDRPLSKAEVLQMLEDVPVSKLQKIYRQYSRDTVYDYEEHVQLAKDLDKDGHLPATFMVVAPGSWTWEVWDDINRMKTLNANQKRRDLQMHVCLAKGSLVLTKEGYKAIEEVKIGDLVLTHKGNWKPVIAKKCTGVNPVIQTKAQGVPHLITTPDHKLWVKKNRYVRAKYRIEETEPDWMEAKYVEQSYVNLKLPEIEDSKLTAKEWWIVGRYLADGHMGTRGDWFISVGENKKEEFESKADGYFGSHAARSALTYRLYSNRMSDDMKDILRKCGRGAENKQVPIEGLCLNEELSQALLNGYISGDGCKAGNAVMASSVSRALLLGMAMVAQRVGIIASVFAGKPAGTHVIEGRTVNQKQLWVLSWRNGAHSSSVLLKDGAWKKTHKPVNKGTAETWSIQVEGDASYTAEGCIVKNCPLQIDIVERIINRYSNKDDLVYDPFGGLMTVPMTAVKMGRRGYGCELNEDYFRDGVGYCQAAEEEIATPTLFDFLKEAN